MVACTAKVVRKEILAGINTAKAVRKEILRPSTTRVKRLVTVRELDSPRFSKFQFVCGHY